VIYAEIVQDAFWFLSLDLFNRLDLHSVFVMAATRCLEAEGFVFDPTTRSRAAIRRWRRSHQV
jgi:hypothetical protein